MQRIKSDQQAVTDVSPPEVLSPADRGDGYACEACGDAQLACLFPTTCYRLLIGEG